MGRYDTVYFNCPACSDLNSEQTKVGACKFDGYPITEVPAEIAKSILNDWTTCYCQHCGTHIVFGHIDNQIIPLVCREHA